MNKQASIVTKNMKEMIELFNTFLETDITKIWILGIEISLIHYSTTYSVLYY